MSLLCEPGEGCSSIAKWPDRDDIVQQELDHANQAERHIGGHEYRSGSAVEPGSKLAEELHDRADFSARNRGRGFARIGNRGGWEPGLRTDLPEVGLDVGEADLAGNHGVDQALLSIKGVSNRHPSVESGKP